VVKHWSRVTHPQHVRTHWNGDRLVRHKQMLPPPHPDYLSPGEVARLLASTVGFAAAISLALFALALIGGR